MTFLVLSILVAVMGLFTAMMIGAIARSIFSDEMIFKDCIRNGLTEAQAKVVVDRLKPKVGEVGLPAWESKKRNLKEDEL